jgi:hypothetical protein
VSLPAVLTYTSGRSAKALLKPVPKNANPKIIVAIKIFNFRVFIFFSFSTPSPALPAENL